MLWGEADRMKNLTLTEETLKNQQGVVGNEVKVNVLNRPYGGFPWLDMPQYANKNWYNAHNFYGDLKDIEAATLADAKSFSQTYYAPNNAALALVGDFDEAQAKKWVEKYFGSIPASKLPPKPDLSEPRQEAEQRFSRTDKLANKPALGIAYQMPPRLTPEHYAMVLLDQMLIEGDDSLLTQELVKKRGYTDSVDGGINLLGSQFNYNGPMLWIASLIHDAEREARSDTGGGGPDHRSAAREAGHEGAARPLDGEAAIAVLPVADAVRRVRQSRPDGELCAVRRQSGADQQPGGQSAEGDARAGAEDRAGVSAADQPHGAGGGGRRGGETAGAGHGRCEMRTLAVVGMLAASCFAQDREAPPPLGTPKPFALPAADTFTLKNGMKVTLAQYGSVPLVSVRADMAFGKANETADQVWLSNLTIQLMRKARRR